MFRTRLAALVVAGSLSFSSGCMGLCNMFCGSGGRPCCNSGPPPCCGEPAGAFSSPVMDGQPVLVPQGGVPVEAAHVLEVACRARAAADRAPAVALVVADHALAVVLDRVASLAAARGRTSRGLAGAIDLR